MKLKLIPSEKLALKTNLGADEIAQMLKNSTEPFKFLQKIVY